MKFQTAIKRSSARLLLLKVVLTCALMLSLNACGGGGSETVTGAMISGGKQEQSASNNMTITDDDYGLMKPNFYYSTNNAAFWSIQAAVAKNVQDQDYGCVVRIDIPKSENGTMPAIYGRTFSIEENASFDKFPGSFFVFNGHKSVNKKVEHGTISFTPASSARDEVNGIFDVMVTDYDSHLVPPPQYHLKGTFSFNIGTSGAATPLPAEVYPENGMNAYDRLCSSCHILGEYDDATKSGPDLSLRGGELPMVYPGSVIEHQGIALDLSTMQDLRIFLNMY